MLPALALGLLYVACRRMYVVSVVPAAVTLVTCHEKRHGSGHQAVHQPVSLWAEIWVYVRNLTH